jgi:hypothetical protein
LITWLLKELEKNSASLFRKADLLKKSKSQFEKLKRHGFLTYVQPDPHHETYPCTIPCPDACPMDVVEMDGGLFAICPQDSEIDPISLEKDELDKYSFSVEKFLEHVRMANRLGGALHRIDKDYLYFGYMTYKGHRVGFIFGFTITRKSVLELTGLKRLCANDDFLVVFSPVSIIEDVFHKRALEHDRVIQTSFALSLNFQTYEFSVDKLLSGAIAREAEEAKSSGKALLAKANKWEEITIDFVDDDTIRYKAGDSGWSRANYVELGFKDSRTGLPNKLWPIFRGLAKNCSGSRISMKSPHNISKDLDRIRSTLKTFFGPNEAPITYNKKAKEYCVKFNLSYKSKD